ncbi:MAG: hypothetical protein H6681_02795 [Desulfobacteraceae bacterium]|nr:hypothetical protein [Desulfobacteraceae bacterium]
MKKNICIIELYKGHSECIYSQYSYLKSRNHNVFLISDKRVYKKLPNMDFVDIFLFEPTGLVGWIKTLFSMKKFLKSNQISTCIFNTAENNKVRDLLIFTKNLNISYFGILHHISKLDKSLTQKTITNRIKGYFTLNDYLTETLKEKIGEEKKIDTLYSIFYPFAESFTSLKPKNEIWIGIPGNIELKRRNYLDLIDAVSKADIKNSKFLFLGKPDEKDIKLIEEKIYSSKKENRFIWFSEYIENNLFLSYLKNCDYIMPLIHGHLINEYINNRISGSFNLGFGLKKSFIMEESFSHIEDFRAFSIFYKKNNLSEILEQIDCKSLFCSQIQTSIDNYSKFDFNILKSRYLDMIET